MATLTLILVLLFLLVFAGMLILASTLSRKGKEAKAQMAQTLGLTPHPQPDGAFLEKISALRRAPFGISKYELRNVSRRPLPDGELLLFDLIDVASDSDTIAENQAVAIRSDTLHLPNFHLFPKVDPEKYALGRLANRVVDWGGSKLGTPVKFPEFPAFEGRYAVSSTNPDAVRRFFDAEKARYFSNTQNYTVRAEGDLFIFAEIEPGFNINDPSHMSRRIDRALEIYRLFQG